MLSRAIRIYALCLAVVGFAVAYATVTVGPYYHPVERVWSMTKLPDTPAMSWYARFAWSALAASAVFLLALPVLNLPALQSHVEQRKGFATALALLAFGALAATLAYLAYSELQHAAQVLALHS